jgi:hypothetical protein
MALFEVFSTGIILDLSEEVMLTKRALTPALSCETGEEAIVEALQNSRENIWLSNLNRMSYDWR